MTTLAVQPPLDDGPSRVPGNHGASERKPTPSGVAERQFGVRTPLCSSPWPCTSVALATCCTARFTTPISVPSAIVGLSRRAVTPRVTTARRGQPGRHTVHTTTAITGTPTTDRVDRRIGPSRGCRAPPKRSVSAPDNPLSTPRFPARFGPSRTLHNPDGKRRTATVGDRVTCVTSTSPASGASGSAQA